MIPRFFGSYSSFGKQTGQVTPFSGNKNTINNKQRFIKLNWMEKVTECIVLCILTHFELRIIHNVYRDVVALYWTSNPWILVWLIIWMVDDLQNVQHCFIFSWGYFWLWRFNTKLPADNLKVVSISQGEDWVTATVRTCLSRWNGLCAHIYIIELDDTFLHDALLLSGLQQQVS